MLRLLGNIEVCVDAAINPTAPADASSSGGLRGVKPVLVPVGTNVGGLEGRRTIQFRTTSTSSCRWRHTGGVVVRMAMMPSRVAAADEPPRPFTDDRDSGTAQVSEIRLPPNQLGFRLTVIVIDSVKVSTKSARNTPRGFQDPD